MTHREKLLEPCRLFSKSGGVVFDAIHNVRAMGQITFWGEIDRQHVLPSPDPEVGRKAVRRAARHFYDPRGGTIAQFELSHDLS